jgi:plasmid stability protein
MPRRKNDEGKLMDTAGQVLKIVRLELSVPAHRNLRIQAAKDDKSMAALARELVEDGLNRKMAKEAKGGAK